MFHNPSFYIKNIKTMMTSDFENIFLGGGKEGFITKIN